MKLVLLCSLAATAMATDLLLPLYQYPASTGGAWDPIKAALAANPSVTATIIINPNNGPGDANQGIDDPQYVAGTKALAALPNVRLIGYVHTSTDWGATRCNVPWSSITADIRKWSTWVDRGVPIGGIFIDEAPADTSNDCVNYMRNLTTFIRTDPALRFGGSNAFVVYNPGGTGPSLPAYYDLQPNLIVALETCFTVPERAGEDYDQCPRAGGYEPYDHAGPGRSIDDVLFPAAGAANAPRTAVLVHGFHDFNGAPANLSATPAVLDQLVAAVVQRRIGATFFNTAGYHTFEDGPASIGNFMGVLAAKNAA
ncbi:hypothetical protein MYCTH_2301831 [Thermothelomyces thermophilus ATCC 42464]|uniref:Uncharacterized protein n=1 Tax=Thermothelomyces thermophilus (strain ATCC 42464 / BCRC 31852 / DSM 1799) TaxID=573729 RepID=G2QAC0_THET4|nr:uncharacterized protein MYCTH_2301831 [Thermothelomyces thermophilus ATCC 42464]AEO56670.1 hypothetical protein MYCTH_2301831 [Thermothelomyces thermophilus ATCC 42464]